MIHFHGTAGEEEVEVSEEEEELQNRAELISTQVNLRRCR
jgi:hypothetical protein